MSHLFISGHWIKGSGVLLQSHNPATEALVWEGQGASKEDLDAAVASARTAFSKWASRPLGERIAFLEAFAEQLRKQQETLAEVISMEMGKPVWDSMGEVKAMIGKIAI